VFSAEGARRFGTELVILAVSVAVLSFQRAHQREIGHEHAAAHHETPEEHPDVQA